MCVGKEEGGGRQCQPGEQSSHLHDSVDQLKRAV